MKTKSIMFVLVTAAVALATGCATKPAMLGDKTGFYGAVAFSPDGRFLAATRRLSGESVVFDLATRIGSAHFQPDKKLKAGFVFGLAYTPDGRLFAAHLQKNVVSIWDAGASNLVARLVLPKTPQACRVSSDGRWLAALVQDQPPAIWEVATGRQWLELTTSSTINALLGFSSDGRWLATTGKGRGIQIWEAGTGGLIGELPPQKEPAHFLAFAPDGGQLAVSADDVGVFQLTTHQPVQTIKAPSLTAGAKVAGVLWMLASTFGGYPSGSSEVFARAPSGPVVFSPTGSHLAMVNSAANTETALGHGKQQVRVFELSNTQLVSTVAYNADVASLAFSPDGHWIATAGQGVDVWDWQKSPRQTSTPDAYQPIWVHLQTNAAPNPTSALARMAARPVRVGTFTDALPDAALGKRTAAFNVKMSDILPARPVAESVREAVAELFAKSASNMVEGAPKLEITGRVKKFSVETPATLVSWKVESTVEVELQVANEQGAIVHSASYTGQARQTTATWLGQTIIERTCNEALQQLLKNIEADPVWPTL